MGVMIAPAAAGCRPVRLFGGPPAGCLAAALVLGLAACGGGGQPAAKVSCPAVTPAATQAPGPGAQSGSASPAACGGVLARGGAKTWHGTLSGTATAIYHDAGGTSGPFTGTYRGTLTLAEDSAGGITGHAKVSASGCHIYNGKPSTSISFDVTGTDDGTQLRLRMIPRSYRENGVSCGFGFGWTAPPPGESYSSTAAVIPITGPAAARADWRVIGKSATGHWTVRYRVDLACAGCGTAG